MCGLGILWEGHTETVGESGRGRECGLVVSVDLQGGGGRVGRLWRAGEIRKRIGRGHICWCLLLLSLRSTSAGYCVFVLLFFSQFIDSISTALSSYIWLRSVFIALKRCWL